MSQKIQVLMDLLKREVCEEQIDPSGFLALSTEEQKELAKIARKHSVAQLLGDALGKNAATQQSRMAQALFPDTLAALNQVTQIEYEKEQICSVLDQAQIPYIALKGARIRPYYPEPWMRTSCDNDILVPENEVERAAELLVEQLEYTVTVRNHHDITLASDFGVLVELHFSLKEDVPTWDRVLETVWDNSHPVREGSFEQLQSDEFFMFHLIAHMMHHFVTGGCGIRPFLDLYLLQERFSYDDREVIRFCRKAGMEQFYENVKQLTDVWFRGTAHSQTTEQMENFLLLGGTYGTALNYAAVEQVQKHSRYALVLHRIFATKEHLYGRYPYLKEHKWLLPVYQVRRWITAFQRGKFSLLQEEWEASRKVDSDLSSEVEQMLKENGLLPKKK